MQGDKAAPGGVLTHGSSTEEDRLQCVFQFSPEQLLRGPDPTSPHLLLPPNPPLKCSAHSPRTVSFSEDGVVFAFQGRGPVFLFFPGTAWQDALSVTEGSDAEVDFCLNATRHVEWTNTSCVTQ